MGKKQQLVLFSKTPEMFVKDIQAHIKKPLVFVQIPPDVGFDVVLSVDEKGYDAIAKDGRLHQALLDRINKSKEYEGLVEVIAVAFQLADAKVHANLTDPEKAMNQAFEDSNKKTAEAFNAINKAFREVWHQHFHDKKEYLLYEMEIAGKLTLGTVSIAANIALLAATPFTFGASTVLGGLGMAKTVSAMAHTISDSLKDAEKVFKEVMEIYVQLTKKGPLPKKAEMYTAELVNGLCKAVLSFAPMKSLTELRERLALAHKKVLGVNADLSAISEAITKQLKKQEKYNRLLTEGKKGTPLSQKKVDEVTAKLQKSEVKLAELLKGNDKLTARYDALVKIGQMYTDWVDLLVKENRDVKIFGKVMEFLGTAWDIGTAFADFNGGVNAVAGVVTSVGSVIADKAMSDAFEKASKK